jgi:hypothetical protein
MSTAAQDVFNRAVLLSDANQGMTSLAASEILQRLNYATATLFARLGQENRTFYLTSKTIVSTGGAAARTIDLSTLSPLIERLLLLLMPDGVTPVNIVDVQDQQAEFAPRAFPVGTILQEVGADWSAAAGPVTLTAYYIYRPTLLLLTGDLTQLLTVPDQFASYFEYDLALYFAQKDTGRVQIDPAELDRLGAAKSAAFESLLQYLDHYNGAMARRFDLPVPTPDEKK